MRQIKYRIWDKTENKFIIITVDNAQLFTGLVDINGVEIYEGDIVEDSRGYRSKVELLEENGYIGYDVHSHKERVIGSS